MTILCHHSDQEGGGHMPLFIAYSNAYNFVLYCIVFLGCHMVDIACTLVYGWCWLVLENQYQRFVTIGSFTYITYILKNSIIMIFSAFNLSVCMHIIMFFSMSLCLFSCPSFCQALSLSVQRMKASFEYVSHTSKTLWIMLWSHKIVRKIWSYESITSHEILIRKVSSGRLMY